MNADILLKLLRNIRDLRYPIEVLRDVDMFEGRLAGDLGVERREAMALLGYLLTRDYVRIVPEMGLVVNPGNPEIQRFVNSGQLDRPPTP